jgi:Lon protease-like protein
VPFANYRRTTDLPSDIAVFPLRGAILLPRANLPLNVFEPRYLAMLDHVISSSRILGIIQPLAAAGDEESPQGDGVQLKHIGCAGRVTAFQERDDGRLAISLTGIVRFRTLTEQHGSEPYRVFAVSYDEFAGDLEAGAGEDEVKRDELLIALRRYLDAKHLQADWQAIENAPTELLVNALSTISPFGPEEKQALLEAKDLRQRAEVLTTLATMELASDDRSGGSVQ